MEDTQPHNNPIASKIRKKEPLRCTKYNLNQSVLSKNLEGASHVNN